MTTLGVCSSYLKKLKQVSDFLRGFIDDDIFEPRLQKHKRSKQEEGTKKLETKMESLLDDDIDYLDTIVIEYLAKEASMSLANKQSWFCSPFSWSCRIYKYPLALLRIFIA